ncbi:uncharacterized protein NECHADRAFT_53945 [Fusarium vanettenii 77-13-4]|uniref:Uncharacterized protein n=1 Tax=Fusarium vanettenii (strain ATCC MYA-4622 / CBS 123669 / FGSC 9596 / NRRL 45880 / 77-13-4) TaxID=660122 RepID=C7Z350_FUSV7|nr:uncharacterized protein NECHADRAFT_53945 [Fusarium vanettenii 77-13-4]EEU41600.1 hypothetical protein NECHADRAFT_53945 [Fusarium vanettenii 77-13-4]
MSKLVEDVKSGLKGIRGAGDAVRGEVLKATDQAFEKNPDHPTTVESRTENEATAEKGKKDLRGADEMLARHEWKRKGVTPAQGAAASENQPVHESDRPAETLHREPGTIAPGETTHYGTGRVEESGAVAPDVSEKHRYA